MERPLIARPVQEFLSSGFEPLATSSWRFRGVDRVYILITTPTWLVSSVSQPITGETFISLLRCPQQSEFRQNPAVRLEDPAPDVRTANVISRRKQYEGLDRPRPVYW